MRLGIVAGALATAAALGVTSAVAEPWHRPQPGYHCHYSYHICAPHGYRAIWDDGRVNPHRGPQTLAGDEQMARIWTDDVPRELRNPPPLPAMSARRVMAGQFYDLGAARSAAADLAAQGVPAAVGQGTETGKYLVVLGPFDTAADYAAAEHAAHAAGLAPIAPLR